MFLVYDDDDDDDDWRILVLPSSDEWSCRYILRFALELMTTFVSARQGKRYPIFSLYPPPLLEQFAEMYLVLLIWAAFHAGILQYAKNKLFCNSILSEIFYAQQGDR
jgi:hypothetical protein